MADATEQRLAYVTSHISMPPPHAQRFLQVFTPLAAALFMATGACLFYYFRYEKQQLAEQRRACRDFASYAHDAHS